MNREDELEAFKRDIDLSEYAASKGFMLDRRTSSRNSRVMRHESADKIIIAMDHDQHWIYFSVHDLKDSGSIIDFVQSREGGTLGDVRRILRPWLKGGGGGAMPVYADSLPPLVPVERDLIAVGARFAAMQPIKVRHTYLESRSIPFEILSCSRFEGKVFVDNFGNAVFAHHNLKGLSGYELKNNKFTGFAPGGEKGLWGSNLTKDDRCLVICETGIDALSYATLHGVGEFTRYVSVAGGVSPDQLELISKAMKKLPEGSEIVVAFDNDEGGDVLLDKIQAVFDDLELPDTVLKVHRPPCRGDDWNDVLRPPVQKNPIIAP